MNAGQTIITIADYTLLQRIGAGSYGEVWRAQSVTGVERAVKVVYRRSFESERPYLREFEGIRRFESIARGHPHLVTVYHVGRLQDDAGFYYVMELADGVEVPGGGPDATYTPRTLAADLERHGHLPAVELIPIAAGLAEALGQLHEHGLIHRDVKPSNIIFVRGMPRLADIGLVAKAGESRSFVGTEGFVPPEGPGTPQGDLFSLGKVLYEAMTGRDRTEFPELPADFGDRADHTALLELNELILRACDRDPARRHRSAKELLGELRLLQGGHSLRRIRLVERRLNRFRRTGWVTAGLASLAVIAWGLAEREAGRQRENVRTADGLRQRAESAERATREQLHQTSVALARASRLSVMAGRRERALAAIRSGTNVRPSRELADELISVLAGEDLRAEPGLSQLPAIRTIAFNADFTAMAQPLAGQILLSALPGLSEARRLTCPEGSAPAVQWSANGRWVLGRHDSGWVRVWEAATGRIAFDATGVGRGPSFSSANRILLPFPEARRLEFRDAATGQQQAELKIPFAFDVAMISPDGESVAINPVGAPIFRVISVATGAVTHEFALDSSPFSLAWSPDSRWLSAGSDDNAVYLWSLAAGATQLRLTGHQNHVHSVEFTADSQLLASSSWDGTTRLWEVPSGREILRLGESGALTFRGSPARLAIQNYGQDEVRFQTLVGSDLVRTLTLPGTNRLTSPFGVSFSADGQSLAVAAWDGAHVLDPMTGRRRLFVPEPFARTARFLDNGSTLLVSGGGSCRSLTIRPTPDQDWTITGSVQIAPGHGWNTATTGLKGAVGLARGDQVWLEQRDGSRRVFRRSGQEFQQVDLSGDGRWLAAGGRLLHGFAVWDAATGEPAKWAPPSGPLGADVAFSPDSRALVVGDPTAYRAYAVEDGRQLWMIARQNTSMLHGVMAFTAEGRFLACALNRTDVAIVSTTTGERLATLEHPDPLQVVALAFTPDGSRLAVAGPTHLVRVWNLVSVGRNLEAAGLPWALAK